VGKAGLVGKSSGFVKKLPLTGFLPMHFTRIISRNPLPIKGGAPKDFSRGAVWLF